MLHDYEDLVEASLGTTVALAGAAAYPAAVADRRLPPFEWLAEEEAVDVTAPPELERFLAKLCAV
jgi:hypothetical protein